MQTYEAIHIIQDDGVLNLHVPIGTAMAGAEVLVTIKKVEAVSDAEWHQILKESYGACAGLGLECPPQPELEERDKNE